MNEFSRPVELPIRMDFPTAFYDKTNQIAYILGRVNEPDQKSIHEEINSPSPIILYNTSDEMRVNQLNYTEFVGVPWTIYDGESNYYVVGGIRPTNCIL